MFERHEQRRKVDAGRYRLRILPGDGRVGLVLPSGEEIAFDPGRRTATLEIDRPGEVVIWWEGEHEPLSRVWFFRDTTRELEIDGQRVVFEIDGSVRVGSVPMRPEPFLGATLYSEDGDPRWSGIILKDAPPFGDVNELYTDEELIRLYREARSRDPQNG